jgi:hypothetical protein
VHKDQSDKARIMFEIAFRYPLRLAGQSKCRLKAAAHHPTESLRFGTGKEVEDDPDAEHY